MTNSLDKGDIVISIFLDLKKTFDTVDHPTLINYMRMVYVVMPLTGLKAI